MEDAGKHVCEKVADASQPRKPQKETEKEKSCERCSPGTFVRHGWQFCMKVTQHWWLLSEGTIFCLTANWLRQEIFLGETAVYRSSLWSADSHLVSPFAATGNLKLLPSGTVGSERPDWSALNVIHKQLVKSLSKCFFFPSIFFVILFFQPLHYKLIQTFLSTIFSICVINPTKWGKVPSGSLRNG